ncbi:MULTISPECIES: NAD(P)/FAD-dependent oxidoreductase [Kitasatospora]|uniref:Putative oxidoreductase n=1 Tax=Kitasatospora setae (strain ATCC 33774 / DSM 43861 / JCM 3304 / KCC A-0304 / NBRC 14216 / KM-6054) TaxID=452652 RepID=E4N2H6_KITSK|nr:MULTISPECIES: NAD(P)/FAD-dependent oxidoreductase [Kitasatospora]BAJ32360.1 putative oxidoreductase [Kitasatospora setae KM-6054]
MRVGESGADRDAVVIGAGLGGLVCAGYLASAGYRVLVVESHDVAGGCGHVFRRRRAYEFDVGVHYLGDCGPDGVLPLVLRGLGIADRVRHRPLDPDGFDRLRLPGLSLDVPASWEGYRARLLAALPGEQAALDEFLTTCREIGGELRTGFLRYDPAAPPARPGPALARWGRRSLADLFEHCGLSVPARAVLAAQSSNYGTPPAATAVPTHAAVLDHYLRGASYPQGGGQSLVAALVEALEAAGGELRTRCAATRVLVDDGRVSGVELSDGSTVRTPLVVSNADYRRTVLDLVGAEHFPAWLTRRTARATMAGGLLSLFVALDTELPGATGANLWWHRTADPDAAYRPHPDPERFRPEALMFSFASGKDAPGANCPPGHTNFQAIAVCPAELPEPPGNGRGYRRDAAYLRLKERWTEAMLDAAEEALGPLRPHLTHLELSTPHTHRRYTGASGGTPYGFSDWGGTGGRPAARTPLPGLHVVGANARYGSGITGAAMSGLACAAELLGRPLAAEIQAGALPAAPPRLPARGPGWDPLAVSRGAARRTARGLARLDPARPAPAPRAAAAATALPARTGPAALSTAPAPHPRPPHE